MHAGCAVAAWLSVDTSSGESLKPGTLALSYLEGVALRRGYRACALGPPLSPWELTKLPLLSLPQSRRSLPTLASWPTPKQSSFLPQGTAWSFIPSNVPMKMTLGVQIVYKDRTTAKLSGARTRVSASVFLTEEKQWKKKWTCSRQPCIPRHIHWQYLNLFPKW